MPGQVEKITGWPLKGKRREDRAERDCVFSLAPWRRKLQRRKTGGSPAIEKKNLTQEGDRKKENSVASSETRPGKKNTYSKGDLRKKGGGVQLR